MEEKILEFENKRRSVVKKATIFICVGIASIIIGMILLLSTTDYGIALVVPGIIFLIIGISIKSKLSKEFKQRFVPGLVKSMYPDSTYIPSSGLSKEAVLYPGFFKRPDRYFSEDYIKASHNGISFEMSDFEMQERHVHHNSKGGTTVTYVTYAKGRFLIFDYARDFKQILKVVDSSLPWGATSGLEKIDTESIEFNKKFNTYTSDPLTAFYILTPQIQFNLLELESKFNGSIYFAYVSGRLYVAICDHVSILDINASKKISMDTINLLNAQLSVPKWFISKLELDSKKYNQGSSIN